MSRSVIYEQLRAGRLRSVRQGRTRLIPAAAITDYIALLEEPKPRRRLHDQRRSRGDGGLHWDESRQRWIATVTVGYDARGKRVTRKASAKTKTEAKDKLKELLRDLDDGLSATSGGYTVARP